MYAEKRMRSTMAPEISAAVMIANVALIRHEEQMRNRALRVESPTPRRNRHDVSPTQSLPGANASE